MLIRKILLTNCHKTLQTSLCSILPQALLSMLLCCWYFVARFSVQKGHSSSVKATNNAAQWVIMHLWRCKRPKKICKQEWHSHSDAEDQKTLHTVVSFSLSFAPTHISFSSMCYKASPCMYCCNYPCSSTKYSRKSLKHYVLPAVYIIHCNIHLQIGCWFSACVFGPKDWEHAKSREVPNPNLKEHHSHPSPPEPHQQAVPSCKLPDQVSTLESPCHLMTCLPAYTWHSLWYVLFGCSVLIASKTLVTAI